MQGVDVNLACGLPPVKKLFKRFKVGFSLSPYNELRNKEGGAANGYDL